MYFKVSKKELYDALFVVSRAISIFSSPPAFSGIKIDVKEDCLILTESGPDVSTQTKLTKPEECALGIRDMGSIVIEAKYIPEIVRKIGADEIEFEMIDGLLTRISGNTAELGINGMRVNEYPAIDSSKPKECFALKEEALKKAILQISLTTSDKEARPVLTGVNSHCEGNTPHCVATDPYRLAKKTIDTNESLDSNITIFAKSPSEVVKTLEDEGEVEIAVNGKKTQFIIHDTIVQTRLIDGVYPETSRLIPLQFDYKLTIDSRDLLDATDHASSTKNDGVSAIKFSLSEQECVLSSKFVKVGSSTEVLSSANFTGSSLEISCNGRYASDAIKALSGSLVTSRLCGEVKPLITKSVNDDNVLQLVLPVGTYV